MEFRILWIFGKFLEKFFGFVDVLFFVYPDSVRRGVVPLFRRVDHIGDPVPDQEDGEDRGVMPVIEGGYQAHGTLLILLMIAEVEIPGMFRAI